MNKHSLFCLSGPRRRGGRDSGRGGPRGMIWPPSPFLQNLLVRQVRCTSRRLAHPPCSPADRGQHPAHNVSISCHLLTDVPSPVQLGTEFLFDKSSLAFSKTSPCRGFRQSQQANKVRSKRRNKSFKQARGGPEAKRPKTAYEHNSRLGNQIREGLEARTYTAVLDPATSACASELTWWKAARTA